MQADILVVGGGIGGLTAALALARDGHRVRVLEKAAQFAELGAATAECADGTSHHGSVLIAADGLHSGVRALFSADRPVCSGFAAYRGTAGIDEVTARSELDEVVAWIGPDRKSTRLNSSHLGISYAVFCLKKKNK